jgi:hypothetical protein
MVAGALTGVSGFVSLDDSVFSTAERFRGEGSSWSGSRDGRLAGWGREPVKFLQRDFEREIAVFCSTGAGQC